MGYQEHWDKFDSIVIGEPRCAGERWRLPPRFMRELSGVHVIYGADNGDSGYYIVDTYFDSGMTIYPNTPEHVQITKLIKNDKPYLMTQYLFDLVVKHSPQSDLRKYIDAKKRERYVDGWNDKTQTIVDAHKEIVRKI